MPLLIYIYIYLYDDCRKGSMQSWMLGCLDAGQAWILGPETWHPVAACGGIVQEGACGAYIYIILHTCDEYTFANCFAVHKHGPSSELQVHQPHRVPPSSIGLGYSPHAGTIARAI